MIKALCLLFAACLLGAPLPAEEPGPLQDEDVYYAPIDDAGRAAPADGASAPLPGSFVSRARLHAFDIADGRPVEGAEIFLAGAYLGRSPLELRDHLIKAPQMAVSARLDGYHEGLREAVGIPVEGPLAVALVSERAASGYTTPAWVVGLLAMAAAAAVYDSSHSAPGLALLGGGMAVISLSQLTARWFHLPALRKRADAYNRQSEPAPPWDAQR
jgi:hypothetical protein